MRTYFSAEFSAYAKEGEGGQNSEQPVVVEVVSHDKHGLVIGFNDRGERCYLQFRLSELLAAVEDLDRDA